MTATSTAEERLALGEAARGFLEQSSGPARVREVIDSSEGWDPRLWGGLAALGFPGIAVPEADGGGGGSFGDLAVVLGALGGLLVPGPFFATAVLAAGGLTLAGDADQRARWLTPLASGAATGTLATCGPTGRFGPDRLGITWRHAGTAGLVLSGTAAFVPDAAAADLIVVACRPEAGTEDRDGVRLVVLERGARGLTTAETPCFDLTRQLGEVHCADVAVEADAVLGGGPAGVTLNRLLNRAAVALAVDSTAGAARVLGLSAAYAVSREQFGRPIGTFQAIKHRCADMAILTAGADAVVHHAVALIDADADASTDSPSGVATVAAVSVAKAHAADAYAKVAGDSIQLHGGTGFTWEHDAHLYLRRARLNQALFGDSGWHRERLARLALDERRTMMRGDPHVQR